MHTFSVDIKKSLKNLETDYYWLVGWLVGFVCCYFCFLFVVVVVVVVV